jgi:hypothetical protein
MDLELAAFCKPSFCVPALANRGDAGISRKQFVALAGDFFLIDPHCTGAVNLLPAF